MNIQKCGIIGCGGVGATTAYTLVESGLFNEMVLIDLDHKKAEGEALDIAHGIPFTVPSKIYAGDYDDLEDAYLVIVAAGANQLPGETRLDIAGKNARVFEQIIPQIVRYNKECILLIVTNPVDVLTSLTLKLSGFPPARVIGSGTVLDTARLKYMLGRKFKLDYRNIHAWMIGEHGDSELAVWSSATVAGLPVDEYCRQHGRTKDSLRLDDIYQEVRDSAYEIINRNQSVLVCLRHRIAPHFIPAQLCLYPGNQFCRIVRFADIIIRPQHETGYLVALLRLCRQDDDRNLVMLPQFH